MSFVRSLEMDIPSILSDVQARLSDVPAVLSDIQPLHTLLALLLLCVGIAVWRSRAAKLEHVPGPWLSKYTDLYRASLAYKYSGRETNLYMELHAKYGDVVRLGPRAISVLDPLAIPAIYGVKARLDKGPNVAAFNIPGLPRSILGIIDEHTHARYRRPIQGAYSLTSLKGYESYVDDTINLFGGILDRYSKSGKPVNLSLLAYYWSYDTVGKLTFGSPYGYLETESDFNGLIHRQRQFVSYINLVTQAPILHSFFLGNPIFRVLPHQRSDFINFTRRKVNERLAKYDPANLERSDLLSHFLEMRKIYPDIVTNEQLFVYTMTNVIAGSLSTSHVLDEIVKYLTVNPKAQQRIREELKGVVAEGEIPVGFDDAKRSLYLEAVIQEGIRIHSMANLSSERIVGAGGMLLPNGMTLPPGAHVGINPAAMNRRPDVFGAETSEFVPERWLKSKDETEEEFANRRQLMDRAGLTFGQGSRSCLGKNIVQLELFKLVASLCNGYIFEGVGEQELYKVFTTVKKVQKK